MPTLAPTADTVAAGGDASERDPAHSEIGIDDLARSDHAPGMSASEFTTLDLILKRHEEELMDEALADLPEFILERQPRVMFENNGLALGRWLMFGRLPNVEWLELSSLSYYVLTERFVDGGS
jgi:hypothetical protein